MKNFIKFKLLTLLFLGCIGQVQAQQLDLNAVKAKLSRNLQMQISTIEPSPVPGLLQVTTERGLFYSSVDGKYFLQARIFNLDEGLRNETDLALADMRLNGVNQFSDSVIEFKAKDEKYVVNVFTDITCGYCRKLHNQIDQYNDLGITVRYLAFPRAGLNSEGYKDLVSVWCADNKQAAMTNAKAGERVPGKRCASKVAEQYAFGQSVGVTGTPNIILPNGSVVGGYQPPAQLLQSLKATL